MDCPVCKKTAMITFEFDAVEIDHCTGCGGIWLDAGELETLLGDNKEATAVLSGFTVSDSHPEEVRKCPICLKKMEKVLAGKADKTVLIDRCRNAHGLWFDKGELDDILAMAQFDSDRKVQNLLTEIFGGKDKTNSES